jgi:hypothetical protein
MNYPTNRVHVYPMIKEAKKQEQIIMQDTLCSNQYNKDLGKMICTGKAGTKAVLIFISKIFCDY